VPRTRGTVAVARGRALYGAHQEVLIMAGPAPTTGTFSREQLVRVLDRLQADGRWSPYHAAALLQELDGAVDAPPTVPPLTPPPDRAPLGNRLAEAAAYAGAVLIGAAGAVIVGQRWEDLGRPGRVALLAVITLVLVAVGIAVATVRLSGPAVVRRPEHAVRRRSASTALTIAAATAAGTVGNLVPGSSFVPAAGTAVLVMAVAQWLAPSAVSEAGGLVSVVLLVGATLDEGNVSSPIFLVTVTAVGLAWAALSWTPVLTVPTLGLALGMSLALWGGGVGANYGTQPEDAIGIAVLVLLAAGGLAGYVRTGRWPLAAAAVVALALLVFRLTNDSLGAPVALLLTGLVLLAAGALLLVRRRSAERS
jgi:hypothetical protein